MNILELIIDEEAELYGIDAISLVEHPAIESDWIAMNSRPFTNAAAVTHAINCSRPSAGRPSPPACPPYGIRVVRRRCPPTTPIWALLN